MKRRRISRVRASLVLSAVADPGMWCVYCLARKGGPPLDDDERHPWACKDCPNTPSNVDYEVHAALAYLEETFEIAGAAAVEREALAASLERARQREAGERGVAL